MSKTNYFLNAIMTTATLPRLCIGAFSKLFWIRTNRVLAWAMIVSPALQWAAGMRFWTGFWIDAGILVAHGLLSLALFGKPETKARIFSFGMHVMGYRSPDMSERNRFLLSGYRIALATGAMLALTFVPNPFLIIAVTILFFYPMLRLGISIVQHLYVASRMAARRWRWGEGATDAMSTGVVYMYLMVSFFNLVRG